MTTARRGERGLQARLAGSATARSRRNRGTTPAPLYAGRSALATLAVLVTLVLSSLLAASSAAAASRAQEASSPAASPTPDSPRLTLGFDELNDSGVRGEVSLFPSDDRTIVQIAVQNVAGNHPAHIHTGTCGDIDPEPEFSLTNVDAEGRSDSVVEFALDDLLAGEYVVDIHLSPTELGTLIACAEIAGQLTNVQGTPVTSPAASPSPSPSPSPTETNTPEATATDTPEATAEPTPEATETPASTGTGGNQVIPREATETPAATEGATERPDGTAEAETPTATADATSDGTGGAIITDTPGKGDAVTDGTDGANMSGAGGVTSGKGADLAVDVDGVGGASGVMATVVSGKGNELPNSDTVSDGTGGTTTSALDGITSGKGEAVGGNGSDHATDAASITTTTSLPRQAGVGTAFDVPDNPLTPAMWATGLFALVLGAAGIFIRRGERAGRRQSGSLPRWVRLGL